MPLPSGWVRLWRDHRDIEALRHRNPRISAYMRYRAAGEGRAPGPRAVRWVPLDDVSPYLVCAVVRCEDPMYLGHRGIWWAGLFAALRSALRDRRAVRGVSTISQQLARNLFLHPERSLSRKLQEAILARRLEGVLDKRRILELYLNLVEWGDGTWGIGAATRRFYGARAAALDPLQSVVLASILPSPRQPFHERNRARVVAVQRLQARVLYGVGLISRDELMLLYRRLERLEGRISAGASAEEIFRLAAELGVDARDRARPPTTTRQLLDDGLGFARMLRFTEYLRDAARENRRPVLPLWWTGETPLRGSRTNAPA